MYGLMYDDGHCEKITSHGHERADTGYTSIICSGDEAAGHLQKDL